MKLKSYFEEIDKVKDVFYKQKKESQRQIDWWKQKAIEEYAILKIGDIVQFDKDKCKIIKDPEIRIFENNKGELIYDLVYVAIKLKANGQPYHDSQSGINRREIWQLYLERGIATKVSA